MTKELMENNYMAALLRAALLLGDLHRTAPVREITISGYRIRNHVRRTYPCCSIVAQNPPGLHPAAADISSQPGVDYLILFPLQNPIHS